MHVVIFTMSLNKGGAERVIANLCNEYLIAENKVTIITCLHMASQYELDERIAHVCLDHKEIEKEQGKGKRFLRRRKRLKECLEGLDVDIMLSILPEPSFLMLSLKERYDFPVIVSVRSDPRMEYRFLPYQWMMRYLYPKADGFIMQTTEAKNYFPKNIRDKAVVIPNPIHKDAIRRSFSGIREKEIVAVGRLIEEKNYPLLLRVYKKVRARFPDYRLTIYGDGPLRPVLEEEIKRLQLEQSVKLAGQRDDIFDCIYKSSLFVMTSNHEGMPNALMEAMALGLPVIATDCPCGGPKFLITNHNNGILVERDNEKALEKAMVKILSDSAFAEKIGRQACKIAETLASEKIYKQWGDYIFYIAGGKNIGCK